MVLVVMKVEFFLPICSFTIKNYMKHSILFQVGQHFPAMCPSFTRQKFSIACTGIKITFPVKLRHVTGKCCPTWNGMLCFMC